MSRPSATIRLWDLGSGLPLEQVRQYFEEIFSPALSCARPERFFPGRADDGLARMAMGQRLADPGRMALLGGRFSPKELDQVRRIFSGESTAAERRGVLFHGPGLQGLLASRMGLKVFQPRSVHIVFTSALACTWDPQDCRYHPHSVLCGFPSVISTSGAVEGPARPRSLYVAKMMGLSEEEARRKYIGRFLEHDDARMPEVAKGLAAQAVFYNLTGEPFCEREDCRLFNARWQEQLVSSQVSSGKFCNAHSRFLRELKSHKRSRSRK